MHEWIHNCSDVDSGQDMEKTTITFFCGIGTKLLISLLNYQKIKIRIVASILMNIIMNIVTPFIRFQQLVQISLFVNINPRLVKL
jgi:hypothetical protein